MKVILSLWMVSIYFVFDVKESYQELKIGLGAVEKTVPDRLGDKLKEVTGEIGTGVNSDI